MHLPANPITPSTRHRVVDADFAAVLEEHLGIPTCVVLMALEGESRSRAVALCRWASRHEEPNGTLLVWAPKYRRVRARRQRTAATPPRGHGRVSPRPSVDRYGPGRGHDTRRPGDVTPDRVATRPGGG